MFRIIFIFFIGFNLISCGDLEQEVKQPSLLPSEVKSESYYLQLRDKNLQRSATLNQAKEFYKDSQSCKESQECLKTCKSIYKYPTDQKECKNLSSFLVGKFQFIYQTIQYKDVLFFSEINSFDLKVFLSFSPEPMVSLFHFLGISGSKVVLKWISSNWTIAQSFLQEDLDLILFKTLLSEVSFNPIESLEEPLGEGRVFQEIALVKQNDFALVFAHKFFEEICKDDKNKEACVVKKYCKILKHHPNIDPVSEFLNLKEILTRIKKPEEGKSVSLHSVCSQLKK